MTIETPYLTKLMNDKRVRQIVRISDNSFSCVMEGGGDYRGYGETVGEAYEDALRQRDQRKAA